MSRIASYRQRKRAVDKAIDDALNSGIASAFDRCLAVSADVNPKSSSQFFLRAFYGRLLAIAERHASIVR